MSNSDKNIWIETKNDILGFDKSSGRIISFCSKQAPDQEFILPEEQEEAFIIQYLNGNSYNVIKSSSAQKVSFCETSDVLCHISSKTKKITFNYEKLDGKNLDITFDVSTSELDPFSHWTITITNNENLKITDIQFPFIVVPCRLPGKEGSEALLRPFDGGKLYKSPDKETFQKDHEQSWQLIPENGGTGHYPGLTFAQFMAYYNDRAGVYIGCQDTTGSMKQIKPMSRGDGIRLMISHIGDWPLNGTKKLQYEIVLRSFMGDWYDAAEIYREWSMKQKWASTPLSIRKDVPEWLLDSPPHIIVRLQGELDEGPSEPKKEFLPYAKILPLLDRIEKYVGTSLVPILMSWEGSGPWVYPECFPPVGGEESLKEFTKAAREREWHVGTFCNGARWVTRHYHAKYDGTDFFHKNEGTKCVCRTHEQEMWEETWDRSWRKSYPCCIHVDKTRKIAGEFVKKLIDLGFTWIQFLDQNVACAAYPCFGEEHGHDPIPGKWMIDSMERLITEFEQLAASETSGNGNFPVIAYSTECPPNEYSMPHMHVCDSRVCPEGHINNTYWQNHFIPLYSYLYHEFVLIQGGFGLAPEPYHMQIKNAYNFIAGMIPGGVIKGDGDFLNKDTPHWAPWSSASGNNRDGLEMLRTTTALRRGKAKDFLVYGRMMKPLEVSGIENIVWIENDKKHEIPAVYHSAWVAQDGRFGAVFANWTNDNQLVLVKDERLGRNISVCLSSKHMHVEEAFTEEGLFTLKLPPLSCVLIE